MARAIEDAGADALIVHGRHWTNDYAWPSDFHHIGKMKQAVQIPVIANGDIATEDSLAKVIEASGCDAYMIARAGSGKPWLYQQLLADKGAFINVDHAVKIECFFEHLQGLSRLESEHQAVLQSKTLVRYYFKSTLSAQQLQSYYALNGLNQIEQFILAAVHV